MHHRPAGILERGFTFYLAIFLFNIILGAYLWFPRFDWFWILLPLPESTAAVMVMVLISCFTRSGGVRGLRAIVSRSLLYIHTAVFVTLVIFVAAEAFFQHVYQRTFILGSNLPLATHFFNMLFRTEIFSHPLFLIIPAAAIYLLLFAVFYSLFRFTLPVFGKIRLSPDFVVLAGLFVLSITAIQVPSAAERLLGQLGDNGADGGIPSSPVIDTSLSYGAFLGSDQSAYTLPGIADRNIHLAIVESYGMTVYTNEHHFRRLQQFYIDQERLFTEAGYTVFTHGYDSTTFGGTSWLADASLLTGIDIHTQAIYDQIVKNETPNMLHLLRDRGYTTILSAPGTKFMTSEYTGFYTFSEYFLYDDFEYTGPFFTFGRLPDQYQLFYIDTIIRKRRSEGNPGPFFVEYILCSSHVPWNYIPPYIESWEGFNNGRVYYDRSRNTWYENSWAAGSELFEGYTHSIRYSLESVFGFARSQLDENDILIVIGDHQPKFPVSEKDAAFGVPVHIISKDRGVLLPFTRFGYEEGLFPPVSDSLPGMERFPGHFLDIAEGRFLQPRSASAPLQVPR